MGKLRLISAFTIICMMIPGLATALAAEETVTPQIVFTQAVSAEASNQPEAEDAEPLFVEYEDLAKGEWYSALEGFFSIASLFETAASAPQTDGNMRTALIGGTTFVSLRDFVTLHHPDAIFGYEGGKVTLSCEGRYMEFTEGNIYYYVDGRILPLSSPCYEKDGCFYVPLRALAKIFSYDVDWDDGEAVATLSQNGERLLSGAEFYDQNDYMLLARLIRAESGNQPLEGKIAVGNVIMNRVKNPSFPNTVSGVIYDRSSGVQFTTAYNGAMDVYPNQESLIAAKLCLEGYSVTDTSLFFFNPKTTSAKWIRNNRTYVTTIGNHAFYS